MIASTQAMILILILLVSLSYRSLPWWVSFVVGFAFALCHISVPNVSFDFVLSNFIVTTLLIRAAILLGEFVSAFVSDHLFSLYESKVIEADNIAFIRKDYSVIYHFCFAFLIVALMDSSVFISSLTASTQIQIENIPSLISKIFAYCALISAPIFIISICIDFVLIFFEKNSQCILQSGCINAVKLSFILFGIYLGLGVVYYKLIQFAF